MRLGEHPIGYTVFITIMRLGEHPTGYAVFITIMRLGELLWDWVSILLGRWFVLLLWDWVSYYEIGWASYWLDGLYYYYEIGWASYRVDGVSGDDHDDRHRLVDEREGSVLQLPGQDPLRVHVRQLLDLLQGYKRKNVSVRLCLHWAPPQYRWQFCKNGSFSNSLL